MKRRTLLLVGLGVVFAIASFAERPYLGSKTKSGTPELREGDILFQTMHGGQSDAIALATKCKWTHVGVAFKDDGQWMIYEAVGPVKRTVLKDWIEQGDGHYVVKRWKESERRLDAAAIGKLRAACKPMMGRAYDWQFQWSHEKIYCSELVWKLFDSGIGVRLCEPKPLKEYALDSELVRRTMKERYGTAPPMDEPMVAPATLFDCALLTTVAER